MCHLQADQSPTCFNKNEEISSQSGCEKKKKRKKKLNYLTAICVKCLKKNTE